jgi:hypothetical protein
LSAAAPFLTASGELEPHNFRRQPIATAPLRCRSHPGHRSQ